MTIRGIVPRYLLATVTAATLAFAGVSATPARAGSDTARIITGIGALAIIGAAIASSRDRRHDDVSRNRYGYGYRSQDYRPYGYRSQGYRTPGYSSYGYDPYGHRSRGYSPYGYRSYGQRSPGYRYDR